MLVGMKLLGMLRWGGTVFCTSVLVTVVRIYQAKHNFTSAHKAAFYTLTLALTLGLGLNFFVSAGLLALLNITLEQF